MILFSNIKKDINKKITKYKWKTRNKHNKTTSAEKHCLNYVKVGNYSYGKLNAIKSDDKSSLIIGAFCSIAEKVTFILGGLRTLY